MTKFFRQDVKITIKPRMYNGSTFWDDTSPHAVGRRGLELRIFQMNQTTLLRVSEQFSAD